MNTNTLYKVLQVKPGIKSGYDSCTYKIVDKKQMVELTELKSVNSKEQNLHSLNQSKRPHNLPETENKKLIRPQCYSYVQSNVTLVHVYHFTLTTL